MHPKDLVVQTFRQRFNREPEHLALAPARVNLLGEHVDYNDGLVLPAAIDRATYIAFSQANSDHSTLIAGDFAKEVSFTLKSVSAKSNAGGAPLPDWALYPAGVAWALNEAELEVSALDAVYSSNVPRGAGLSSSASVEMAFVIAWQTLGGWTLPPMQRALLGQKAESKYVGVDCGIMDQFASACGVADHLLVLDCRSLEWQTFPIPRNIAIVIADTSVRRKLTSSGYNERHRSCEEAVKILAENLPGITALRDVSVDDFNRLSDQLPVMVERRARHVIEEMERTRQSVRLLDLGRFREFGKIMNECHVSLRDLYEVSIPELDKMVEIAQSLPGCFGARLTGAGFGGCTVNLVEKNSAKNFAEELTARYQRATNLKPEIYICRASEGARII
ncbi:MAG: galactokinase [Chloroflexi bacterium]|nr:galactokinase [Chloroflexota bacterium]